MGHHNSLLDIDVTLHSDVQSQLESEKEPEKKFEKTTQKMQGKVKTPVQASKESFEDVPKAQIQDDSIPRDELNISYSDNDIEREKQS
jgi:hypothetical protein